MDAHNPFAAPVSDAAPRGGVTLDEDRLVTSEIVDVMSQTRPWVATVAVIGFIVTGLLVLGAVAVFAFGTFASVPFGGAGLIALVYLVVAGLYLAGSLFLWRYAGAIRLIQQGYGVHALTDALRHQKSFWRLVGILSLVVVSFYLLFVVIAIAIA